MVIIIAIDFFSVPTWNVAFIFVRFLPSLGRNNSRILATTTDSIQAYPDIRICVDAYPWIQHLRPLGIVLNGIAGVTRGVSWFHSMVSRLWFPSGRFRANIDIIFNFGHSLHLKRVAQIKKPHLMSTCFYTRVFVLNVQGYLPLSGLKPIPALDQSDDRSGQTVHWLQAFADIHFIAVYENMQGC